MQKNFDCEQKELCDYVNKLYYEKIIYIIKNKKFIDLFVKYKNKQNDLCKNSSSVFNNILNKITNKESCHNNDKNKIKKCYDKLFNYINNELVINLENEIETIKCICNELRIKYIMLLKNLLCNKKFNKLLIKYSKCSNYNNSSKLINFIKGKLYCISINCCKCLKNYLPRTIALLNLSGDLGNIGVKNTLEYYWNNYSVEYKKFPTINTFGSIPTTLELLEKYYNLGYRYFLGFTSSTTVAKVLDWFLNHPDATGISPSSTASSLSVPKNIFRMAPTDNYILDSVVKQLEESSKIYYIYSDEELAPLNILKLLEENETIKSKLVLYGVKNDLSNLTVSDLQNLFTGSDSTQCVLLYLFFRREYISLYNNGLTFPGQQYDIIGGLAPVITNQAATQLNNKYNISTYKGINTSITWRRGYYALGQTNYNTKVLNILNLLNTLVTKLNVENINSHFGITQFEPVTRDLIYPSFLVEVFSDGKFINKFLFVDDPYLGKYEATFENSTPIEIPKITNNLPIGKAIGLLELTNSPSDIDQVIYDSIYYYWYNDNTLPKFPIINTEASIIKTIDLLNKYYDEGYRIFLGFSRSTVVFGVLEWFKNHPDATGISVVSRASNLSVEKNIYRLDYPQNLVIETLIPIFEQTPTLYYIYTEGELVSLDYLEILSNNPNINLKTLAIKRDSSNLTLDVLTTFLEGSTSDDTILLVLFFNQQQYFNLYNQGLFFGGEQYYIIGALPQITGIAKNILNNKVINIQSVFANTSLLWRMNTEYLTKKYKKIQSSYGLINGLKMIQYILENKSISLLGSHLGVLEFDKNNDLKYQSFLTLIYRKDVDNFVKYQIQFNDPLLGYFIANFV